MQAYESLFSEYPDVLTVHQVRTPGQNYTLTVGSPTL